MPFTSTFPALSVNTALLHLSPKKILFYYQKPYTYMGCMRERFPLYLIDPVQHVGGRGGLRCPALTHTSSRSEWGSSRSTVPCAGEQMTQDQTSSSWSSHQCSFSTPFSLSAMQVCGMCVCVWKREYESVSVCAQCVWDCVWVSVWEFVGGWQCGWDCENMRVCEGVVLCVQEKKRKRICVWVWESVCVYVHIQTI